MKALQMLLVSCCEAFRSDSGLYDKGVPMMSEPFCSLAVCSLRWLLNPVADFALLEVGTEDRDNSFCGLPWELGRTRYDNLYSPWMSIALYLLRLHIIHGHRQSKWISKRVMRAKADYWTVTDQLWHLEHATWHVYGKSFGLWINLDFSLLDWRQTFQ